MHRQDRLFAIQVDLGMRALARLERRALTDEPTSELIAPHFSNINNFVYIIKFTTASPRVERSHPLVKLPWTIQSREEILAPGIG